MSIEPKKGKYFTMTCPFCRDRIASALNAVSELEATVQAQAQRADEADARVAELEAESKAARDEARICEGVENADRLKLVGVIRALSLKISGLRDGVEAEHRDRTSLAAAKIILQAALTQRDREVERLKSVINEPRCIAAHPGESTGECGLDDRGSGVKQFCGICRLRNTLAQRDREVLALRKALEHMGRCAYCAEDSWEDCEGGRQALAALASTAQAADEAERKILESAWERVNHMPGDGITVGWRALKAKILGTENGEAR